MNICPEWAGYKMIEQGRWIEKLGKQIDSLDIIGIGLDAQRAGGLLLEKAEAKENA